MHKIITRSEAIEQGLKHYFTGNPCKRGHLVLRKASDKSCMECNRLNQAKRRMNPDFVAAERMREREKWASCESTRIRKKKSDKARRSSPEFLFSQRLLDREKYHGSQSYRAKKISSACAYSKENRDKINSRNRAWFFDKYRSDNDFRVAHNVRGMLARIIRASKLEKNSSTTKVLGYSFDDFKVHIERQFSKGMNWGNHGEWHIDHIVPISHFIGNGETDPKVINALPNLRPLWAKDNFSKGASYEVLL